MRYQPSPPPIDVEFLVAFLTDEFRRIANAQGTEITLPVLKVEPRNAADGTIAYANGVDWNPGAGVGFYGRQAGAWVKL